MNEKLSDSLVQIQASILERDRLQKKIESIRAELIDAERTLRQWEKVLHERQDDLSSLEGLGLRNLFFTILGDKDRQLEQGRQEFLKAKLRHDFHLKTTRLLEENLIETENRLNSLSHLDEEYRDVLNQKEMWLRNNDENIAQELFDISSAKGELASQLKEISDAIDAGQELADGLSIAIECLRRAEAWGTWDLFGGGLIVSLIKHDRIDQAADQVMSLQPQMNLLCKELGDISPIDPQRIISGPLYSLSDTFLDNLVSDWIVQARIGNSLHELIQTRAQVNQCVQSLEKAAKQIREAREDIERKRQGILGVTE